MKAPLIVLALFVALPILSAVPGALAEDAPELGRVHWGRNFDQALAQARTSKKPVLVLFQEIPGCSTCKGYGGDALSHPLLVEAIETLFVPVAIKNNVPGDDERVLKSFEEPAWNNPVVRIVDADRKPLAPRLAEDYSSAGLAKAMCTALEKAGREVPPWLALTSEELNARRGRLEKATFAMHCFWEGEGALGDVSGVIGTTPGFVDGMEVVEVEFDPARVDYKTLVGKARQMQCASKVFTRNDAQQKVAAGAGVSAQRSDENVRPDREPKYYLSRTPMRAVPMMPLQAARVNARIGHSQDAKALLSPRQLEILKKAEGTGGEPANLIGAEFVRAWDAAQSSSKRP